MILLLVVDWSNRSKRNARQILQTRILVSWRFISAHKDDCAPLDVTILFVNPCLSFSLRVCVSVCVDVSLDVGTHRSQFQSFLT